MKLNVAEVNRSRGPMSELQEGNSGNDFELAVPVAHTSEGETVRPGEAMREEDHYCPACEEELIYRAGEVMRPHFAHHGGNPCSSPETILHHAAKRRLAKTIRRWIEGRGRAPRFARKCRLCKKPEVEQKIPDTITEVRVERALPSGYKPDILLLAGESPPEPAAAIEVVVTHEVSEQKRKDLNLPWIEVTAESVMEETDDQETECFEVRDDGLKKLICAGCNERLEDLRRKKDFLERWNLDWPQEDYRITIKDCGNCGATIPVFRWDGDKYPPTPRPHTLQHRHSKAGLGYWVNTCPRCESIQCDRKLKEKPQRKFGMPDDGKKSFLRRAQDEGLLP